jgi:hypothetical protein
MSKTHPIKLSVFKILRDTFTILWLKKGWFTKGLAMPVSLLVVAWAMQNQSFILDIYNAFAFISSMLSKPVYLIAFTVLAVRVHRLILYDEGPEGIKLRFKKREFMYAGWIIAAYVIFKSSQSILLPIMAISNQLSESDVFFVLFYFILFGMIIGTYVIARFCLVLPATAIDRTPKPQWSWKKTRHIGWRVAVIIGIYPFAVAWFAMTISNDGTSQLENVVISFLYCCAFVLDVFAVSLVYKELVVIPEESANTG